MQSRLNSFLYKLADKDLRAFTLPAAEAQGIRGLDDAEIQQVPVRPLATGQEMIKSGHPLAHQLKDRVRVVQGKEAML